MNQAQPSEPAGKSLDKPLIDLSIKHHWTVEEMDGVKAYAQDHTHRVLSRLAVAIDSQKHKTQNLPIYSEALRESSHFNGGLDVSLVAVTKELEGL